MNELAKALDELEKAATQLMKVSAELAEGTERLNRQLQTLVDTVRRRSQPSCDIDAPDSLRRPNSLRPSGQSDQGGVLSEVKRFLDRT